MSARCLYLDLDGTLLGRGASLLHDGEGAVSIEGVRGIQACLRAGVEVVLMSGRRRTQVAEDARLLGGDSYIFEADALLAKHGHRDLRLVDNGAVGRRSPALAALPQVRGYHLVPAQASKVGAVAVHRRARGYAREQCLAVGDSREDLACAAQVGSFWLVANALERDPSLREAIAAADNVRVAESGHGAGVYEAVLSTLASARAAHAPG